MPKIKTPKSIKKRIIGVTADGSLRLRKQSNQHRARFKSKRSLSNSKHSQTTIGTVTKKISKLL
jgi:ribosomal protein L35